MIKTKEDLRYYIKEDRRANGLLNLKEGSLREQLKYLMKITIDKRIVFHTILRRFEYYSNVNHPVLKIYYFFRLRRLGYQLGFTIHKNCFGPGLKIAHYGSIVVNPNARIGKNCIIHSGVNIGETNGNAPIIGDNAYIGPGAKIFGDITIGNNVRIGANAVVFKSFAEDNLTLVGVPCKKKHRND